MKQIFCVRMLTKSFTIGRTNVVCFIPKPTGQIFLIAMPSPIMPRTTRGFVKEKWKHISLATFSSETGKMNREWGHRINNPPCHSPTINL